MKRCPKCGVMKPLDEFYISKVNADGYTSWCKQCNREYHSSEAVKERRRQARKKLKRQVISHYGNRCACCGESEFAFLTMDHINGGGSGHRKKLKISSGTDFYSWVIRNGFPDTVQVLCFNCNCGRQINKGICPHKKHKRAK